MDWIRENKPLAVILGIILATSLALGYFLFDSWSKYSETKESYLGLGSNVAQMRAMRLAPTEENLKAKQALVEEFATQVNQLGKTLLILQPKAEPMKNIDFQSKLKEKVAEARKDAGMARMALPAEFAFGFDEYTSNLPAEAASTELSGYLDAMVALVKLCMSCNVESVDVLDRSKLAIEQSGSAAPAPQQRNGRPGVPQQQAGGGVLEKRQISAILTLDQGALQLLTTKLATPAEMPFFTTLRLLRIENQRQEGPVRAEGGRDGGGMNNSSPAPAPTGGGAATGAAAAAAADEIRPPDPAPPDATPLIGLEKLKVRMEIDLVKFLDAAGGAAPQQAAPAAQR